MPKNPDWIKSAISEREDGVPQQVTIVRRTSPQAQAQMQPQQPAYGGMSSVDSEPISAGKSGAGVDGVVQPGKMVDAQLHEGEGIVEANAMQNLTDDEFKQFRSVLASGKLNKNMFRQAINMPTVGEYATGGVVRNRDGSSMGTTQPPPEQTDPVEFAGTIGRNRDGSTYASTPMTTTPQIKAPEVPGYQPFNVQPTLNAPAGQQQVTTPTIARQPTVEPTKLNVAPLQDVGTVTAPQIKAEPTQPEVTRMTPPPSVGPPPVPPETVTGPPEQPSATSSTAGDAVRSGLQSIVNQSQGMSEADKKIANFYLSNMDASNAASLRLLESRISGDGDMSEQGKEAARAMFENQFRGERATMAGELAAGSAQRAGAAARDAVTLGQQVRSYEDITLPAARQNMEIMQKTFDEITLPTGKLNIQELESRIGSQNWNEIQDMIDKNVPLSRINQRLTEQGQAPLTDAEYVSMIDAGALGERNWNRQLSMAGVLLNIPGQAEAAATMYSNIFPGVDFDFEQLITQDKAKTFSTGLVQMSSYAAADIPFDQAIEMMKNDETLTMMGITEAQAANMYNAMNVNAIDAQWEAIETSDEYQALLNSDNPEEVELAKQIKLFNRRQMFGLNDWETLHEYEITDSNGVKIQTIYGKDSTEADKFAAKNGYSVEDTGRVEFAMKSTITGPTDTTDVDSSKAKWDEFLATVPDTVKGSPNFNADEMYQQWQNWSKDNTGDNTYDTMSPQVRIDVADKTAVIGTVADNIISDGPNPETNPQYDEVIKARTDMILAGEYPKKLSDMDVNDPTFQAFLKVAPEGTKGTVDFTNDHYQIRNLTGAIDKGYPVKVGDKYYFVEAKVVAIEGKNGMTTYRLSSVDDRSEQSHITVNKYKEPSFYPGKKE